MNSSEEYKFDEDLMKQIMEEAGQFKPSDRTGDFRTKEASSKGGFALRDKNLQSKLRSAGKEVLWRIGKQILSGKFNLISIAFPIRCAAEYTMLQAIAGYMKVFPHYISAAALTEDPLERMKLLIVVALAHLEPCNTFEKPLNPILGETYSCYLADGTKVYCEQTSHHPPITHIHTIGPNNIYEFSFHSGYSASGSWNSIKVNIIGHKCFIFKDGTKITTSNTDDVIQNTLFGTMTRQVVGNQVYKDETNHINAEIEFGSTKKKKEQDYVTGKICQYGQEIYSVFGNYNGYVEFNGERYWDIRDTKVFELIPSCGNDILPSDSRLRVDLNAVKKEPLDSSVPQDLKEQLENDQRRDATLRKTAQKLREENPGLKFLTKDMFQ